MTQKWKALLHLDSVLTTKAAETGMNNFSYEGLERDFCIHGISSMSGFLMSAGIQPLFLDDMEEAVREGWNSEGDYICTY